MDNDVIQGKATAVESAANVYTADLSLGISELVTGGIYIVTFPTTNTGAVTLNISSTGAIAVSKDAATALVSGDIVINKPYMLHNNGSVLQILDSNPGLTVPNLQNVASTGSTAAITTDYTVTSTKAGATIKHLAEASGGSDNRSVITGDLSALELLHGSSLAGAGEHSRIVMSEALGITVEDTRASKGMVYAADYSSNFSARSLIDKAYGDGNIGGKSVNTLITSPAAGQDGFHISWDNGSSEYTLTAPPAGADGDGIYDGSGSLSGATTVTMATNKLTFASTGEANLLVIDSVNNRIGIGIAAPTFDFEVGMNQNAATGGGFTNTTDGTASQSFFRLTSNAATFFQFQAVADSNAAAPQFAGGVALFASPGADEVIFAHDGASGNFSWRMGTSVTSNANRKRMALDFIQGDHFGLALGNNLSPSALLHLGGFNFSVANQGTNGLMFRIDGKSITDTSTAASGTATNSVVHSFGIPTLAATNASVTTTNAATVYIGGAPTAGPNMTLTNAYALWVNAGDVRLGGNLNVAGIVEGNSAGGGSAATLRAVSTTPALEIRETGGAVDNKSWDILGTGEALLFRTVNDANTASATYMQVDRTGTAIDNVSFPNGTVDITNQIKIQGGSPAQGKSLISDANGLATWEVAPNGRGVMSVANQSLGTGYANITGATVTLPSAGTYRIFYSIRASVDTSGKFVTAQLFNATAASAIANTEAIVLFESAGGAANRQATSSMEAFITVTVATVINLQAKGNNASGCTALNDPNGRTVINFSRI